MTWLGIVGIAVGLLVVSAIWRYLQRRRYHRLLFSLLRLTLQTVRKQISDFSNIVDSLPHVDKENAGFNIGILTGLQRCYKALKELDDFEKYIIETEIDKEIKEDAETWELLKTVRQNIAGKTQKE